MAAPRSFAFLKLGTLGTLAGLAAVSVALVGCKESPKEVVAAPAASTHATPRSTPPAQPAGGSLRLGAPIEASTPSATLADVAKNSASFVGKKFATTGKVSAVCQHMGCWMELTDEGSEAHVKMSGHSFFVPRSAKGRQVKVLATLVAAPQEERCENAGHDEEAKASTGGGGHGDKAGGPGAPAKGKGCRAEAEEQLGRPLAKMELVAEGVEIL